MSDIPVLPGIESKFVDTPRLRQHVEVCGPAEGIPVVFIHGNFSSALYFEELMLGLSGQGYRCYAPDLRGYGWTEARVVDASRGCRDWVDDVAELMAALQVPKFHLVGWSMGGGVVWRYIADHPDQLLTATVQAPCSPYGFGGTKGTAGAPCYDDWAGCGGGTVNPEFVKRVAAGDRSSDDPNSPRNVINAFYYHAPFRAAREDDYLTAALQERTGDQFYPGDFVTSTHWPNVAPGHSGPVNAFCGKSVQGDALALIRAHPKPPVLWIRGADDMIVSDTSLFDVGTLGKMGLFPGWPGEEEFPPQPMIGQTRTVLNAYRDQGGSYREVVFDNCGHSPHIEHPAEWQEAFVSHTKLVQTGGWQAA